ncbi:hypothetical protein CB0940_11165 [Cercospora beticola]|uniref:Uncharacterized protein n=1 Tax=Cercospora beticola TaxID=122368 RepID=A0A2G5HDQ4_CERBT|nr:hypothetical protein CB0940_11165 [Cercospora beticola]PIA90671.1 hypothetical protein CB0940_11165 [Cercospora beticola]WPB07996.1 hypothetical protein RHO25_012660 [Cercospora beticola]CAK1368149.1 unnamed protein product [Cercospora beticola]
METTDTIGRGWYGVIIVPKKQKDESFHDKAMRKAAKIIVQTRPDLAIGDFGKPVRERDHKVAFVLDSSGNIVVPKKRKNENRGEKAARKAAEMAVRMQTANMVRIRQDAASNGSQDPGVVDLAGDDSRSIIVPKKRKGETPEERAVRKAAKRASKAVRQAHVIEEPGRKSQRRGTTMEERLARSEERRRKYQYAESQLDPRLQGKDRGGDWESEAFVSRRFGALPTLQLNVRGVARPKMETMEEKCHDCGETHVTRSWQLGAKNAPEKIECQPQYSSDGHEDAETDETRLRDGRGQFVVPKKRREGKAEQRAVRKAAKEATTLTVQESAGVARDANGRERDRTRDGWHVSRLHEVRERREAAAAAAAAQDGEEIEMFGLGRNRYGNKWLPYKPKLSELVEDCVECGDTEANRYRFAMRGRKTWVLICDTCYQRAWRAERAARKGDKKKPQAYYGARSDYILQGKLDNVPY